MWLLVAMISTAGAEEAYRWRDGQGHWHFGGASAAPGSAEAFDPGQPEVVVMPHVAAGVAPVAKEARRKKAAPARTRRARATGAKGPESALQALPPGDRKQHEQLCDKWREQLLAKRHFDHRQEDAYDRECILKVHW
jgi:hypothetical protein